MLAFAAASGCGGGGGAVEPVQQRSAGAAADVGAGAARPAPSSRTPVCRARAALPARAATSKRAGTRLRTICQPSSAARCSTSKGLRNAPSINYLAFNTAFSFAADGSPHGGFFWDGRADSLAAASRRPAARRRRDGKREPLRRGRQARAGGLCRRVPRALRSRHLQPSRRRVRPAHRSVAGRTSAKTSPSGRSRASTTSSCAATSALSDAGKPRPRALQQPSEGQLRKPATRRPRAADGSFPLFTDFGYANLGVPRNPALQRERRPGLLRPRPLRRARSWQSRPELCGAFKVPSLRNVAIRARLFPQWPLHGRCRRCSPSTCSATPIPQKWYPLDAAGTVDNGSTICRWSTTPNVERTTRGAVQPRARRHAGAERQPRSTTCSRSCRR